MNELKVWPHLTIVAIIVAVLAGAGVAFYLKHERTAEASALPNAARIQRIDGDVALSNSLNPSTAQDANQWAAAAPNEPFSVGDRIYTRDNSRASLAFTGRNFARLDPNSELEVLSLANDRTQLALRDGSAIFDVGYLAPGQLFEVGTPYGAVDFDQPGLYNLGINNGGAYVSVLSGLAQVVGLAGSGQINKGEMLTLLGATATQAVLSRLNGRDAGYLVNDYYAYQYPNYYDGRYSTYDAYLNDPFYYDPYRRNVTYQYAPAWIPGLNDLDSYGDWQNVSDYGYVWRPRVETGWAPYQQGYWMNDYPYGLTWVSTEPWGYAPYHYGRWAFIGNQWAWIPDSVNSTPMYAPALVAFLPLDQYQQIGWVPLAPGDPYAPRYYDTNWQPYYFNNNPVVSTQLVNLVVPGAVTVVPIQQFDSVIDRRTITRVDPREFAQVNPTLDPLLLTPLRNAVIHSAWGRGKIALPPGIAKKLDDTTIVTSVTPAEPPFGKNLAKRLRLEQLPATAKNRTFNVRDDRGASSQQATNGAIETGARNQGAAATIKTPQGNGEAMRNLPRQTEAPGRGQAVGNNRRITSEAKGERVGRPAQQQVQSPRGRIETPRAQPEPRRLPPARVESRPRPQVQQQPVFKQPSVRQQQPPAQPQNGGQQQQRPAKQAGNEGRHGPPAGGPPAHAQQQPNGGGQGKGKGKGHP